MPRDDRLRVPGAISERILVAAAVDDDARMIERIVADLGADALHCGTCEEWLFELGRGAAVSVVTQEVLDEATRREVHRLPDRRPPWSDVALIVLRAPDDGRDEAFSRLSELEAIDDALLLDRPTSEVSLRSAVRSAIRTRRRQDAAAKSSRARSRNEAALRRRDWRIRRLVQGSVIGVVSADDETILDANDAFLGMIGASREDLDRARLRWRALTPSEYLKKDEDALRQLLEYGSCIPYEKEFFRTDGSRVPVLVGGTLLSKDPWTAACFIFDRTATKRTEVTLTHLNETLERRVAKETAAVDRYAHDLRRLSAKLSETEQRERERLARVLHDGLQQWIQAARLRLPVVRDGTGDGRERALDKLDESLEHCMRIARDLSHELNPPVLKQGTLLDIVEWIAGRLRTKYDMNVVIDAPGDSLSAPEHLRVFVWDACRELLFNVIKHARTKDARVGLALRDRHLFIEVEDGGSGFDPSAIDADAAETEGVGLFHIRDRARSLGGRLEIEATARGGGRFRIVLPIDPPTVRRPSVDVVEEDVPD